VAGGERESALSKAGGGWIDENRRVRLGAVPDFDSTANSLAGGDSIDDVSESQRIVA